MEIKPELPNQVEKKWYKEYSGYIVLVTIICILVLYIYFTSGSEKLKTKTKKKKEVQPQQKTPLPEPRENIKQQIADLQEHFEEDLSEEEKVEVESKGEVEGVTQKQNEEVIN